MRKNTFYKNDLAFVVDLRNQPVIVPLDIENRISPDRISIPPRFADVVEGPPRGFLGNPVPSVQGCFQILVSTGSLS